VARSSKGCGALGLIERAEGGGRAVTSVRQEAMVRRGEGSARATGEEENRGEEKRRGGDGAGLLYWHGGVGIWGGAPS
jgi:hypothetical protein